MTAFDARVEALDLGASIKSSKLSSGWEGLYKIGAAAALLAVVAALVDVIVMFIPGTATTPGTLSVADWFEMFQLHAFLGLRNLGLLNMITMSASIPIFLALCAAHRQADLGRSILAVILVSVGAAIYVANNTALPMLTLSGQYAAAATESQRSLIVAAGAATLAREDLTAGAYAGFLFVEIAGLLISAIMLRSRVFGKPAAILGLLGEAFLLIFNACAAFVPVLYDATMPLGVIGGLASMVWLVLIARRLLQLR